MENQNIQEIEETKETKDAKNGEQKADAKNDVDFEKKFDEILNARMDKIAKSVLKGNGMDDDKEIEDFIKSYHSRKEKAINKQNAEIEAIKKENEELKAEKFQNELASKINGLSTKLGFDSKYTNQITKLADLNDVKDENGKINEEKLEAAISKVLEDCEVFKVSKEKEDKKGFITIGAGQKENLENTKENLTLAQLMKQHSKK